uniref:Apolipoprotein L n=1 Tax=Cyprinodon variegatus TaxID=28743 RepID=A0A3Q2D2Q1_CYPVA
MNTERKLAELENVLDEVLKGTLEGLEQLDIFLEAIEKLAVTSLNVFTENQILHLPETISFNDVQVVIKDARQICPLLLEFKRDAKSFFLPKLHNVEVLTSQLQKIFDDRLPQMLKFLDDLEQCAVQLDRMNKGAKISSVTGSSVGAVGGVLSIVGLALIPVTAGVSSGLIIAGVAIGVTSGTNSLVTTATEFGVNRSNQKRQSTIGKSIDSIVDTASALRALRTEEAVASAGKVVTQDGKALRNISGMAADVPDIGQAAVKGPLALSKGARGGFIALNALFLGMDIFFITKDSMSLAKGTEANLSKFLRARIALFRSQIEVLGCHPTQ